jgi:hypothetical protein
VRVRRHQDSVVQIQWYQVWIDGTQMGELHGWRREVVLPVAPGTHHIQVRCPPWTARNSETLSFHAQPGEQVCFNLRMITGTFRGTIDLSRRNDAPSDSVMPPASQFPDARVLGIRETLRFEEPLGEDVRLIDNRTSPAPVTRSLRASREWTRTLTVGADWSRTWNGEAGANLLWLSAKGSIEAELQRTFSVAIGTTHVFEEEISVSVPERTSVRVILRWKRIWQCGEAHVLLPDASAHVVPYQVVVNVTFDQSIGDYAE